MKKVLSVSALALVAACGSAFAQNIGPSTTVAPYVLPNPAFGTDVRTTSIFTTGDIIGGYKMAGIPDGLGAFQNAGGGSFTLFMNHEIPAGGGIVRPHGSNGAFVSRWEINNDFTVTSGRDHNTAATDVYTYTPAAGWTAGTTAYSRFCSADLPAASAFKFGSLGTDARIYMNGEESGPEGRAFGHVVTGGATNQSWQLPHLGRFSWENSVASPKAQQKTVVMGMDDTSNQGQVYMYVGDKTNTGNDVTRAGLTNGKLFGIKVDGLLNEDRGSVPAPGTRFSAFDKGDVSAQTGAQVNSNSVANGVTNWLRPEDGAFDTRPGHENNFYFVTTDRYDNTGTGGTNIGRSRLWRLTFDDIANPEAGGTVTALLDGTEGAQMMDNICIDSRGRILIQEDIGGQNALGKIWLYDTYSDNLTEIAAHNPTFFGAGAPGLLTIDEESSGIIDAKDILGDGWFLFDVQAHYSIPGELYEGGQLLSLYVDPRIPAPGTLTLLAAGGLVARRRRRA